MSAEVEAALARTDNPDSLRAQIAAGELRAMAVHRLVRLDPAGMTPAELRFKEEACRQVAHGTHPTPTSMNQAIHGHRSNNLGGKQSKWIREVVGRMRSNRRSLGAGNPHFAEFPSGACEAFCCVPETGYIPFVARPDDVVLTPEGLLRSTNVPLVKPVTIVTIAAPDRDAFMASRAKWTENLQEVRADYAEREEARDTGVLHGSIRRTVNWLLRR